MANESEWKSLFDKFAVATSFPSTEWVSDTRLKSLETFVLSHLQTHARALVLLTARLRAAGYPESVQVLYSFSRVLSSVDQIKESTLSYVSDTIVASRKVLEKFASHTPAQLARKMGHTFGAPEIVEWARHCLTHSYAVETFVRRAPQVMQQLQLEKEMEQRMARGQPFILTKHACEMMLTGTPACPVPLSEE